VDAVNSLASAESELGMTEARLGHLREAAQHYERAVAIGERLVQLEPDSVNRRRSLMIAYSHVGDVLGLPSLPNLGDAAGAEAVYTKMIALAKQLHEADAYDTRSATDYAIALMRLGSVIPAARSAEKEARLEQSSTLLHGLLDRTPDNVALRLNAALVDVELGHVLRDRGEPPRAARYYRRTLATTRPVLEAGNVAPLFSYTVAVRELAKLGGADRAATLALVNDALQVVERHIARQSDPGAIEPRILIARLYGALMTAHAGAGHLNEAAAWRRKALALWDELSASPKFTSQGRREMEAFKAGFGPSIPP
jgi:tetratricopeptide (TPR) repeat protein